MTEQPHCPKCGIPLPADAPAGLCPKCLVQAGLESEPQPHSMPAATMPSPAFSGFEPLSVENLAGKFPHLEILELLGKGGMGAVYKARQPGLDRLVAVKILPPEIGRDPAFAERFTREARILARLSHNHIVSIFEFGQADGLFYIVMEYVDGVNLRQTIQTGKLTPAEALAIVPQICEALQFAHDEGFVHRDIKPENILIDKRGRVKIADFGLAKLLGQDAGDHLLTATHQVMGTLRYMAPEQMLGTREVDHRADIYSLGVIFYELLTGEVPMGKFAPPSKKVQIDIRLDEIVLRALEQDPEQRYQHASEVKTGLDSIRTTPEPLAKPATERDPLDGFRELARFSMTPNARYGKRVGFPLLVLFGLWLASTIALHILFGQQSNYQEEPILVVQGGGLILFCFLAFVLHLAFFFREHAAQSLDRQALPKAPHRESVAGLPETQVRFVVSDTSDVPRQANFHFSTLGYHLIEQGPDLCVFERGHKWAGLWAMDIRRLHTILTVRTAPAADGGLWVSCNWSMRKLGSWIPASVIAKLEAEGLGLETVLNEKTKTGPGSWPPAGRVTPVIASEPRVSRFAVAGAVWALFGLLAIIPAQFFMTNTALRADGKTTFVIPTHLMLMGVLSIVGAAAPLGTTILGALAIGHIRRSGGRIIGLPLAVADVLFFPLLAVFAGIAVPLALALHSLLPFQLVVVAVPSAAFALVVCLVVGNYVWCAVASHSEAPAAKRARRQSLAWVLAAIIVVLACGLGWMEGNWPSPASKVPAVPPLKTITSGYGVQFLVPAGNVAVFEIVTRKDNVTVPVPTHCGYVMASRDTPMEGTLLWSPMVEEIKAGDVRGNRRWQIEIRTSGGGGGRTGGLLLSPELSHAVGASSHGLGVLESNEEVVHWGAGVDASNLPANGLIGLRVTVLPHGQNRSGTGISHTDWKSPPKSSTTRRKLDP